MVREFTKPAVQICDIQMHLHVYDRLDVEPVLGSVEERFAENQVFI
jgi:hypothetical protein